jgi:hypothetical protein
MSRELRARALRWRPRLDSASFARFSIGAVLPRCSSLKLSEGSLDFTFSRIEDCVGGSPAELLAVNREQRGHLLAIPWPHPEPTRGISPAFASPVLLDAYNPRFNSHCLRVLRKGYPDRSHARESSSW